MTISAKISFLVFATALVPTSLLASPHKTVVRNPAQEEAEGKSICSSESNQRLSQVELHGETRFTEFKFEAEGATSSSVDFAEIGSDAKRRHRRKPAKVTAVSNPEPQMGLLLTMHGWGHEKNGWRNLLIRCGVHNGHLATFTYELLDLSKEPRPVATTASGTPSIREPTSTANNSN